MPPGNGSDVAMHGRRSGVEPGTIAKFFQDESVPCQRFDDEEKLVAHVADHLQEGKVVG